MKKETIDLVDRVLAARRILNEVIAEIDRDCVARDKREAEARGKTWFPFPSGLREETELVGRATEKLIAGVVAVAEDLYEPPPSSAKDEKT